MNSVNIKKHVWTSCCFKLDKRCVVFTVQTLVAVIILIFCGYRLATEPDCDRSSPYWSLVGSIVGFFFGRGSLEEKDHNPRESLSRRNTVLNANTHANTHADTPIIINMPPSVSHSPNPSIDPRRHTNEYTNEYTSPPRSVRFVESNPKTVHMKDLI